MNIHSQRAKRLSCASSPFAATQSRRTILPVASNRLAQSRRTIVGMAMLNSRRQMTLHLAMVVLAACASNEPEIASRSSSVSIGGSPPPGGWKREPYVAGLTFFVPPDATVARPQGVDSAVMVILGHGYSIFLDDYGWYSGPTNGVFARAPASIDVQDQPNCGGRIVLVQLPTTSFTSPKSCDGSGCHQYPGRASVSSRCQPGDGCTTLDRILATAHFTAPPYAKHQVTDPSFAGAHPVCRLSKDG